MKKTLLLVLLSGTLAAFGGFQVNEGVLTVSTPKLKLEFQEGIIVSIQASGENFIPSFGNLPEKPFRKSLVPDGSQPGVFKQLNADSARFTYTMEKGKIFYEFKLEKDDILVRMGVDGIDLKKGSENLDIHVAFLNTPSVITGIGSRTLRNDPAREENLYWPGSAFHFPRVLIAEGKKGVVMFNNESSQPYQNIFYYHTPESDHVVLRCGDNNVYKKTGKLLLVKGNKELTPYFRISAHKDWVAAARIFRKNFEKRTGAVPLWKNPSVYARKIHAVFTGTPNLPWKEDPAEFYRNIARDFNPENLLLFYWNANSIITLGDHRYSLRPFPSNESKAVFRKMGFQWIGFHGYSLICNEETIPDRHKSIGLKWIPAGYKFTPDYDGKPEDFYKVMTPYASRRSKPFSMLNPASRKVEDYLVRNIVNCAKYQDAAGFYLDISGGLSYALKPGKIVFDGKTYLEGDVEVFRRIRKENPDILLMSEHCGEWIMPYIFYTWEGVLPFSNKKVRINHPLRGALFASYTWMRETMVVDDPIKYAYYGTLPEVVCNYGSANLEKNLTDPWYNERAKLFIREKLFNDLPETWDPEALAYYRSAKNGYFQFRKTPYGYAYTDAKKQPLLGIYKGTAKGIPGFMIPQWCAYDRNGTAIGLNPEHFYRFIKNTEKVPFTITALSDGCFLESVRNQEKWTSVRLNSKTIKKADFTVKFDQKPFRVLVNGKEQNITGNMLKATVDLPASVQVFYSKPAVDISLSRRNEWKFGYDGVNGLHASHGYRGYYFNIPLSAGPFTFDKQKKDCVNIGSGRYGGYAEKMAAVPAGKKTLKFFAALKNNLPKIPMKLIVTVNGKTVMDRTVSNSDKWQELQADAAEFSGQEVLINFAYRYADPEKTVAQNFNNVLHLGGFSFE